MNRVPDPFDLVGPRAGEVDGDPDDVRPELGVFHVQDAGAIDAIVGRRAAVQPGTDHVDDEAVRFAEREVPDLDGPADVDHYFGAAGRGHHADPGHLTGGGTFGARGAGRDQASGQDE